MIAENPWYLWTHQEMTWVPVGLRAVLGRSWTPRPKRESESGSTRTWHPLTKGLRIGSLDRPGIGGSRTAPT